MNSVSQWKFQNKVKHKYVVKMKVHYSNLFLGCTGIVEHTVFALLCLRWVLRIF